MKERFFQVYILYQKLQHSSISRVANGFHKSWGHQTNFWVLQKNQTAFGWSETNDILKEQYQVNIEGGTIYRSNNWTIHQYTILDKFVKSFLECFIPIWMKIIKLESNIAVSFSTYSWHLCFNTSLKLIST